MKRLLAVVVAALLIGGAVLVRNALDDRGGASPEEARAVKVVCARELEAVCDEFGYDSESASSTVTDVASGESDAEAWLTLNPWPAIAGSQGAEFGTPIAVGSTRLAVVIWKDRRAVLADACEAVDWRCLGDVGGTSWGELGSDFDGDVRIGLPSAPEASGLLLVGNAIAGYFDNVDFGINDLPSDDGFDDWFEGIRRSAPADANPLATMLTVGRAAFTAVGTTEAASTRLGAREDDVDVLYPQPVAVVQVVLVPVGGADVGDVQRLGRSGALKQALTDAGFTVPAAAEQGLPTDDVLEALRGQ